MLQNNLFLLQLIHSLVNTLLILRLTNLLRYKFITTLFLLNMKRISVGLIFLFFSLFTNAQQRQIIDISTLQTGNITDATPLLQKALQQITGDATIIFPKGTYNFYPDKALGKYHSITNHDNGYRNFAFFIKGYKNLTIDGQGSEFIFHGKIIPFLVENSENISLKGFSIDWKIPFYVQAEVLKSDSASSSMLVKFTNESEFKKEGNSIAITANQQYLPFLGEDMYFDPKTKAVAYRAKDYLMKYRTDRELTAKLVNDKDKQFSITAKFARRPPPAGLIGIYKGNFGLNRHSPAIHIIKSAKLMFNNINIYHAGGMGVIAEKSADIYLNQVNVKLREGSQRLVTTTADATHFCNVRGKLLIENCLFENMLDDATNVHGTYVRIDEIIDKRTALIYLNHAQQTDYEFASKGDTVQIVNGETLSPKGSLVIDKVVYINERYSRISFTQDVNGLLQKNDGLENISWYPEFTFRNNVVQNNRARSVLVSIPKKVLIENNTFTSMMTAILFEGDMKSWYESGSVKDVTIRNNRFLDCGYGGGNYPIIWINPQQKIIDSKNPYEKNIHIENNLFRSFDKLVLKANSVDGLTFRNNSIEDSGNYQPINPSEPDLDIKSSKNVSIEKNVYKKKGKIWIRTDNMTKTTN